MNRLTRPKVILSLAAIFVAGAVSGSLVTIEVGRRMMPNKERIAAHWSHELETKLNLTPEQLGKVREIIGETMDEFRTRMCSSASSTLSACNARIACVLTAEQNAKFADIQKDQQEFIRKRCNGADNPSPAPRDAGSHHE